MLIYLTQRQLKAFKGGRLPLIECLLTDGVLTKPTILRHANPRAMQEEIIPITVRIKRLFARIKYKKIIKGEQIELEHLETSFFGHLLRFVRAQIKTFL